MSQDDARRPHRIIQPEGWAAPRGYVNGVAARGTQVYVAGQIGWDAQCKLVGPGFLEQVERALANVLAVVEAAGGTAAHLVRLTWYVTDIDVYRRSLRELGAIYRRVLGTSFPPMALVQVVSLVEPGALVEIEATAVIPD
jgi:enamine deaminase RidA (YjgF/YER057c/UK114 family)